MADMLNLKKWVGGGGVDQQQVGMAIRAPDGANKFTRPPLIIIDMIIIIINMINEY